MNIMGLFGAPTWLRSAVLFRLSIVDALIAFAISFVVFSYFSSSQWVHEQFENIGISVVVFDKVYDSLVMLVVSMIVSILLASFIVLGHKEEV
jgi:cell division transport system permease protein